MTSLSTNPQQSTRHSLQRRLAVFYATGIFVAGIVVLAIVNALLLGTKSTTPAGSSAASPVTTSANGIAPHQLLVGSGIALAILVPLAVALGWLAAGHFLRPLRAITSAAQLISAGNLHQRLHLGEPNDELTDLGRALDDLFDRLQASFDAQRNFVANASHELRTPLAGLRTLLEVALADPGADAVVLRAVCQEALALGEHQERLVQALLTLATSERGVTRWDTFDLAQVTEDVIASRRDQAAALGVRLNERLAPAPTAGNPRLVETLVANLIENAIDYNHPDGSVEITTATSGTQGILTVTNSGPVITDVQLQRLFQPFERLSPDRNGHRHRGGYGLGLAIVNAVTQAHHATLTTSARPEGGLCITVKFTGTSGPHHG